MICMSFDDMHSSPPSETASLFQVLTPLEVILEGGSTAFASVDSLATV